MESSTRLSAWMPAAGLMTIDDSPDAHQLILGQVVPTQPPEVQVGLLAALGQSQERCPRRCTGRSIWHDDSCCAKRSDDAADREEQLVRRLLDGIESGKIDNREVEQTQWTILKSNPDEAIAKRASELQKKTGHAPSADRKEIVEKFLPLASKEGNPAKGRIVFEQNCIICHTIEGRGGQVGPVLTGVGARPKADLIGKILDPNRSIEGTYRQWIVKTKSGDVIAGRIFAENKASDSDPRYRRKAARNPAGRHRPAGADQQDADARGIRAIR